MIFKAHLTLNVQHFSANQSFVHSQSRTLNHSKIVVPGWVFNMKNNSTITNFLVYQVYQVVLLVSVSEDRKDLNISPSNN